MKSAISIVKILNSKPLISLSWGISNLHPIKNGITMKVNGKKHKGKVQITFYHLSNFKVSFFDTNNIKKREFIIDKEELIPFIDSIVEGE